MDKKVPGIPSLSNISDEETRKVLQSLMDGWRVRNGHTNDSGAQFVTRDDIEQFIGSGAWSGSNGGGFRNGTGANGPTAKIATGGVSGAFRDHVSRIIEEIKNSLLWKSLGARIDRLDGPGGVLDRIGLTETGVKKYVSQTANKIETIDAQLVKVGGDLSAAVEIVNTEVAEGYARAFNVTTLQTMVAGGNLMAQEALDIINDPNNTTSATWQVKFDIDGYVVGAGLGLEGKDGHYTSQFLVKADRFAIGTPGEAPVFPFIADESGVYVNGNLYVSTGGPALADLALDVGISLSASNDHWYVDSKKLPVNTLIYLVAVPRAGLNGKVTWSKTGTGTTPPAAGTTNNWTIRAIDQIGKVTTYTATLVSGERTYTKSIEISRLGDGEAGSDGVAGAHGSLTGYGSAYSMVPNAWSDGLANRVIFNMLNSGNSAAPLYTTTHLTLGDTVTLSNRSTFAATRYWSGVSWLSPGAVIDGNLLVNGTVSATAITAGAINTSGSNALINIGTTSFIGNITSPLNITKVSAQPNHALITASNNKDTSVCIWGASTYEAGNAISGTWHKSESDCADGKWTTIGILGSNGNSAAVAGNVYENMESQAGGYFRFHTTASDDPSPAVTNYTVLASQNFAVLANGKVRLHGAGSPISLGYNDVSLGYNDGVAGQVLTSSGAGLTPTWTTPSVGGGGWSGNKCFGGSATSSYSGFVTVNFPSAFSDTANLGVSAIATDGYVVTVTAVSTSSVIFKVNNMTGAGADGIDLRWTAVGV